MVASSDYCPVPCVTSPQAPEPLIKRLEKELLTFSTYLGQELNNPGPTGASVMNTIPTYRFRGSSIIIEPKKPNTPAKQAWTQIIYGEFMELVDGRVK